MSFLGRIIKWGLLALIAAGGLWFLWLLAWVLYWGSFNPGTTRFMAIRLAELREKTPTPACNISGWPTTGFLRISNAP